MSLRSAEVAKITEILRKICKPMVRDFHEIQKLQSSRNISEFFQKLHKRTEYLVLRELNAFKNAADLNYDIFLLTIDGKENFLRGIPYFATSILLKKDNDPFICVTEIPMFSTTFWAKKGHGAFLEDISGVERLRVSNNSDTTRALILLGNVKDYLKPLESRVFGAITQDITYVASGRIDSVILDKNTTNSNIIAIAKLMIEESYGAVFECGQKLIFSNFDLGKKIKNHIESLSEVN